MNVLRLFFGKALFVLIAVAVVGGSLMLLGENKSKQTPQTPNSTSKPLAPTSVISTPVTTNKTQDTSPPRPTIDLKGALKKIFKSRVFPTSPPIVLPTAVPTKASSFSCSAEGQEKINAYNAQIKQEYDECMVQVSSSQQQASQCSQGCLSERTAGLRDCTSKSVNQGVDYNTCINEVESKHSACVNNCYAGMQIPNNCTLSYQEKQKYVLTLISQYCGLR